LADLITTHITYRGGMHFVGESETRHQVHMDSVPGDLPSGGPTPMEVVLQAAAICSAMDVATILNKRHKHITSFDVEAQGARRDSFPRIFTAIHIIYKITGPDITQQEVEKAARLSHETYCSVVNMLKPTVEVSYAVEVRQG
jgi:putative redox protein